MLSMLLILSVDGRREYYGYREYRRPQLRPFSFPPRGRVWYRHGSKPTFCGNPILYLKLNDAGYTKYQYLSSITKRLAIFMAANQKSFSKRHTYANIIL